MCEILTMIILRKQSTHKKGGCYVQNLHRRTGMRIRAGAYAKDEPSIGLAANMGAELITCNNPDKVRPGNQFPYLTLLLFAMFFFHLRLNSSIGQLLQLNWNRVPIYDILIVAVMLPVDN